MNAYWLIVVIVIIINIKKGYSLQWQTMNLNACVLKERKDLIQRTLAI